MGTRMSVGTIKKRCRRRAGSRTSKESTGAANKASCLKGLEVLSFIQLSIHHHIGPQCVKTGS